MALLLEAATSYAARGWPVLPCHHPTTGGRCSCGRPDCSSVAKHPATPRGLKDASADPATVEAWWSDNPDSNIGIRTGVEAGVVVLDVDPRHGGDEALAELVRVHGELPATVEALTGGGGRHLVFKHPGGTVRNRSNMRPGIDVRGDGGYVIAPPSVHATGQRYRWREGHGPHDIEPAKMPAWLLSLATRGNLEDASAAPVADHATPPAAALRALAAMRKLRVDDHRDGSRRLFAAAGIAVRFGLDNGDALATIRTYLHGSPLPRHYSDTDILKRLEDAERAYTRGGALGHGHAQLESLSSGPPPEPFRPFPVDALPDRMRAFVEAVAGATATDPAYAALAAMVVVAGCVGNRVAGVVKSGWVEPGVLWGVLVGRSGATKSPVLKLATRAVVELFKAEQHAFRDAMKGYLREVKRYGVRLAEWKKDQRDGPPTDPPDAPECPTQRRLIVSDATVEKLGAMLEQNPLGLLLVRDELAAWIGAFDRYAAGGKGSDQPAWLSMHDAAPVVIDRKTTGSYFVERAAVSVLGTIQPGTLARVFGRHERDAGLLARVLLAYPPDRPGLWTDTALPDAVASDWKALLEALLALPAGVDEHGGPRPRYIPIGDEARPFWIEWHNRHARELADIEDDDLGAHFAKLKGGCVRIALLFACVEVAAGGGPVAYISADAMRRAASVVEWLKFEGRRVYALLGENKEGRAGRQLVEWIERHSGAVTVRDLTHGLRQYRGRADAAKAALDALAREGRGKWEHPSPGDGGGRPAARFVLDQAVTGTSFLDPVTTVTVTETTAGGRAKAGFGDGDSGDALSFGDGDWAVLEPGPTPPARHVDGVPDGWDPGGWADELARRAALCIDPDRAAELRAEAERIRAAS